MFSHGLRSSAMALFALTAVYSLALSAAMAAPEFRVRAQTRSGNNQPPVSNTEQTAYSHYSFSEDAFPQNYKLGDAFARSGPGGVGASIHIIAHYPNAIPSLGPNLGGHNASADASFVLDDLIIVSRDNPSEVGSVQGSFRVELSGSLSADAVAISGMGSTEAFSRVNFEASLRFPNAIIIPGVFQPDPGITSYFLFGNLQRSSFCPAPSGIAQNQETGGDLLAAGFTGDAVFTSELHTLPLGMHFGMDVRLSLTSQVSAERSGQAAPSEFRHAEGAAGFGNTMSFPLNVEVFSLPPGYTAHSVSGRIVDNRYVLPPILSDPRRTGTPFTLSLPTQVGLNYVLEFKNSLADASWIAVQTNSGTGGQITLTNTGLTQVSRFYRVRVP